MGEDPIQKYWTLRQKALIFDVPEKPIEIRGPDSVKFLDKVLTRKVSNMKIGRGYYAIACTPKGGIFMDGVVFRFDENHFWYVQADGPFETWLLAHSEGFDVEISDDVAPSGEDKDVLSSVAGERVVALAAVKHVISTPSLKDVVSNSTLHDVVTLGADECVIAFSSIQMIISSSSIQEIALVVPMESVVLIFSEYPA